MSKKVLLAIADGSEEIEAVTVIDVLRRAGLEVVVASVAVDLHITASRGVRLVADCLISDCVNQSFDLIVLPGGMPGAEHLRDSPELQRLLQQQQQRNGLIAAICAAPAVVLAQQGLLPKIPATAYPSFSAQLPDQSAVEQLVVSHQQIITSQGPGSAMIFALTLVERLLDRQQAQQVATALLVSYP